MENHHILLAIIAVIVIYYLYSKNSENMSVVSSLNAVALNLPSDIVPLSKFQTPMTGKDAFDYDIISSNYTGAGLPSGTNILIKQTDETTGGLLSRCASTCLAIGKPVNGSRKRNGTAPEKCSGFVTDGAQTQCWIKGNYWNGSTNSAPTVMSDSADRTTYVAL